MNSRDYWAMRSAQDMVDRMGTAEQTAAEMNKAIQQSADYIAKEVKAVFRGIESFGISESEAFDRISKTDRRRANYYNFYTGKKWGEITNYDLALDSSVLGVEGTAKIIAEVAKALG